MSAAAGGDGVTDPVPHLEYEVSEGVATIRLNRPDRHNALSPERVVRLAEAWTDVRDNPDVRVALLEGAGYRSFCAGADLARLIPLFTRAREPDDEWDERLLADRSMMSTALLRGFELYKPVVVAITATPWPVAPRSCWAPTSGSPAPRPPSG